MLTNAPTPNLAEAVGFEPTRAVYVSGVKVRRVCHLHQAPSEMRSWQVSNLHKSGEDACALGSRQNRLYCQPHLACLTRSQLLSQPQSGA